MLTTSFWKRYFEEYDLLNELTPYRELLEAICVHIDIHRGDRVLDVGSGTGNLSMKLEKSGAIVTGIDFSKEGIEIHKAKTSLSEVIHGDITKPLPFSADQFTSVVSNNVLYTIPREERLAIMKELYRILKPGGKIAISNVIEGFRPHIIYIDHVRKLLRREGTIRTFIKVSSLLWPTIKILYYNYLISKEHEHGAYDFFRKDEQRQLLEETGFKDVSGDISTYSNQAVLNWGVK